MKYIRDKDYKVFREIMDSKCIALPDYIEQFYVECDNEDEPDERFNANKDEFDKIFKAIKSCPKMFKEIKKVDKGELDIKSGLFELLVTKSTIIFIDQINKLMRNYDY